jgi:hypothetical protein
MILEDKDLIREILLSSDVSGGFYGDASRKDRFGNGIFYLFNNGCLFPSVVKGAALSIHAAIPKNIRGKESVVAAKSVIAWAFQNLEIKKVVARVERHRRNVSFYAVLCGLAYTHACDRYSYYEVNNE